MNEREYVAHWYLCARESGIRDARLFKAFGNMEACRIMVQLARMSNRQYAWAYNHAR